jgi:predicted DNA-binding protein
MSNSQTVSVGIRLPRELKDRVDDYCQRIGMKKATFYFNAIRQGLEAAERDGIWLPPTHPAKGARK